MGRQQNMPRRTVALVRAGGFSHVNENVLAILQREFGDRYEIEDIDIARYVPKKTFANFIAACREYGADLTRGRRKLRGREPLVRNAHFFQEVRTAVHRLAAEHDLVFTLQTQSLWDASTPGIPHFVYTDHTHLANLRYREFDHRHLGSNTWINLESQIYQNARQVLVTSEFAKHSLIEDYGILEDKIACVYSGINLDVSRIKTQSRYDQKNILFVGIDWDRKGGPELLEAFGIVCRNHPDAHLTIVGCSPKVKLANTSVAGRVARERMGEFYRNASIFCLPSVVEPSAVALVEASAHALPVVATRVGGTADRVIEGRTGYLVEPRNTEQLAGALSKLLADPQKRWAMGGAGHRHAMEHFVWDKVGAKICHQIRLSLAGSDEAIATRYVS